MMWNLNKKKFDIPKDYVINCDNCNEVIMSSRLESNNYICPQCSTVQRMNAFQRINMICDKGSFKQLFKTSSFHNYLEFEGYEEKVSKLKKDYNLDEAVICGVGQVDKQTLAIAVMDSRFLMGSMGSVVGHKITKLFEYATKNKLPVVIYCASGGARMQEGIISLMQMAKITNAVKKHSNAGLFYMPILTDPTTGGVTASFAMLGDIIISEPNTLICFAGPRVIKETIKAELPEGFQKSEFLLEHGFLDAIVERKHQRSFISFMIKVHGTEYNGK